jgi:hypothetical protein
MRLAKLCLALTPLALGCHTPDARIASVEQSLTHSEQSLARAEKSYDSSERDIARLRATIDDMVTRWRLASQNLEMAARDYEYAAVYHHLSSDEFARAARNYEAAAAEYEVIATMLLRAASSKGLLRGICGQSGSPQGFDELGTMLEQGGEKPFNVPLPVLESLVRRAARMLLCQE